MEIHKLPGEAFWLGKFLDIAAMAELLHKHWNSLGPSSRLDTAQRALGDSLWAGYWAVTQEAEEAAREVRAAGLLPFAHQGTTFLQLFMVSA